MVKNRAAQIEELLQDIKISPEVSVGELVGGYLQLELRKPASFSRRLIWSLRHWLFPKRSKVLSVLVWSKNQDAKARVLIGTASNSPRLLGFFEGLVEQCIDCSFDLFTPQFEKSKKEAEIHISISSGPLPSNVILSILRRHILSLGERLLVIAIAHLQWRMYTTAKNLFTVRSYRILLVDYDRFSSNIPLVLAARTCNIPSVSLVHGATNPIDHYVPVLANQLWVWGKEQEELFKQQHRDKLDIRVVGNPKVKPFTVRKENKLQVAGLAMTRYSAIDRRKLVNLFLQGTTEIPRKVIKMHPQDKEIDYVEFRHKDIELMGPENDADQFLGLIDILCVRRSQMGSDALSYDIPIIVCDGLDSNDLQNGEALKERAKCPLIEDYIELKREIDRLSFDSSYLLTRLSEQKTYFDELFSFTGTRSTKCMVDTLLELINVNAILN